MVLFLGLMLAAANVSAQNYNPLPDTGQTRCYDVSGNVITCPVKGQPLHGQDAQYQGALPAYQDNGNGTVSDLNTRLMWIKKTADVNSDGTIYTQDKLTWWAAINYCANLNFAGHGDWRLPSIFEVQSIVDYGRYRPAINPVFISEQNYYWSATTDAHSVGYAWDVGFPNGDGGRYAKTKTGYVRCVRSELSTDGFSYVNNGDGTVSDRGTGLTWQGDTADTDGDGANTYLDKLTWENALSYCENLSFAGHSDWRLPNIRELISIIDYTQYNPAINPAFKSLLSAYWSATTCMNDWGNAYDSGDAWNVFFIYGNDYWGDKTDSYLVRCVRSGLSGRPSGIESLVPIINFLLWPD